MLQMCNSATYSDDSRVLGEYWVGLWSWILAAATTVDRCHFVSSRVMNRMQRKQGGPVHAPRECEKDGRCSMLPEVGV